MYRFYFFHNRPSMIINDFHIFRVSVHPFETDPPPLIDPNAMLPLSVSRECFQPIGRRHSQVLNCRASVQHPQLAIGCLLNVRRQTLGKFTSENLFRFFAGKTFNHTESGYNAYRYPLRGIILSFVANGTAQRLVRWSCWLRLLQFRFAARVHPGVSLRSCLSDFSGPAPARPASRRAPSG